MGAILHLTVSIQGPLAISFDVEHDFHEYKGGIFRSDSCSEDNTNHAMLAVGYGEEDGKFYIYNETQCTFLGAPPFFTVDSSYGVNLYFNWKVEGYIKDC